MGFVGIRMCSVTDTVTLRGQQNIQVEREPAVVGKLGHHRNNQAEVLAREVCIHCKKGWSGGKYREQKRKTVKGGLLGGTQTSS